MTRRTWNKHGSDSTEEENGEAAVCEKQNTATPRQNFWKLNAVDSLALFFFFPSMVAWLPHVEPIKVKA